jgi:hypothetical protein
MSRYIEFNCRRGKLLSEIISDINFTSTVDNTVDNTVDSTVDNTVDVRISTSPAVDTNASEDFCAKNFHIEKVTKWCERILTKVIRQMGCNEGLYHCLR